MYLRKEISNNIVKRSMHNYLDLVFVLRVTITRKDGGNLGM